MLKDYKTGHFYWDGHKYFVYPDSEVDRPIALFGLNSSLFEIFVQYKDDWFIRSAKNELFKSPEFLDTDRKT